jgi:two-component system response regulator (stage 0 sporulation protein F)
MVTSPFPLIETRPRVLIIDDEEAIRTTLRVILQADYEILEADSALSGLEILQREHADLVTLDVRMPGQSGIDALRLIRQSKEYRGLPVILITGHGSLESACEALRLGATDYIEKPFGVDQVKASVRKGLSGFLKSSPPPELKPLAKNPEPLEDLARLGRASAAFTHDLASPLQVLTMLSVLASQKIESDAPSTERDAEVLVTLKKIGQLLSWSGELMKGWQTLAVPTAFQRERIPAGPLLDKVIEVVRPYADLNAVDISRRKVPPPLEVVGDRTQLERALVNIALNGIKASTAGRRTVELSAVAFQHHHIFRVSDSGQGFSHERLSEVMRSDPFVATGKSRRGLGLFIADWIAVNHGGKLQFICEKDLGTTVELFIPLA